MIVDINHQEVLVGDKVLVAFASNGYVYLEPAIITSISSDGYSVKIRFINDKFFIKTKTLSGVYRHKLLKQDG